MSTIESLFPAEYPSQKKRRVIKALLVTGDRNGFDRARMREVLTEYPAGTYLIHGDQVGVDKTAGEIGADLGHVVIGVPYLRKLGRQGGPARNSAMLKILLGLEKMGLEISVVGFHYNIKNSKGTANMLDIAESKSIPTVLVEK